MVWYDYVFLVSAVIIIILSLFQGGKSEGASGAITGGGLNVFAKTKERGAEKVISWLTFAFVVVFLFLAIIVASAPRNAASSASTGTGDAETAEETATATIRLFQYLINFIKR